MQKLYLYSESSIIDGASGDKTDDLMLNVSTVPGSSSTSNTDGIPNGGSVPHLFSFVVKHVISREATDKEIFFFLKFRYSRRRSTWIWAEGYVDWQNENGICRKFKRGVHVF